MRTRDLDDEQAARLHGLMAMLALPARRGDDGVYRRLLVEIEVARGRWAPVDSVIIESDRLVFSYGVNGHRREYTFVAGEDVPQWRTERPSRRVFVNQED